MEERGLPDEVDLHLVEAHRAREALRVIGDALRMTVGVPVPLLDEPRQGMRRLLRLRLQARGVAQADEHERRWGDEEHERERRIAGRGRAHRTYEIERQELRRVAPVTAPPFREGPAPELEGDGDVDDRGVHPELEERGDGDRGDR